MILFNQKPTRSSNLTLVFALITLMSCAEKYYENSWFLTWPKTSESNYSPAVTFWKESPADFILLQYSHMLREKERYKVLVL